MPVSLCIRPNLGLMFVNFSGHAKAAEAIEAFESYRDHPEFATGQKHLIDFTGVTSFEGDFTKLMELHAKLLEAVAEEQQVLFVYCAPTPLTQQMAQISLNTWSGSERVITRLLDTESAAMDVIGLPNLTFAELTKQTA